MIEAGKIDHYARADGAARHAAAGSTRYEGGSGLSSPFDERGHVLGVGGNGDRAGNRASDPRRLGINRSSELVLSEDSAKVGRERERSHSPRLLTRGGFEE
jgi:hypothetical protein